MALSRRTYEIVTDLIENKMSCMEGWDQATSRERAKLETCLKELEAVFRAGKTRRSQSCRDSGPEIEADNGPEPHWTELEDDDAEIAQPPRDQLVPPHQRA